MIVSNGRGNGCLPKAPKLRLMAELDRIHWACGSPLYTPARGIKPTDPHAWDWTLTTPHKRARAL